MSLSPYYLRWCHQLHVDSNQPMWVVHWSKNQTTDLSSCSDRWSISPFQCRSRIATDSPHWAQSSNLSTRLRIFFCPADTIWVWLVRKRILPVPTRSPRPSRRIPPFHVRIHLFRNHCLRHHQHRCHRRRNRQCRYRLFRHRQLRIYLMAEAKKKCRNVVANVRKCRNVVANVSKCRNVVANVLW